VSVDEKLDTLITQQNEMMALEEAANSKLDVLLSNSSAADRTLEVTFTGRLDNRIVDIYRNVFTDQFFETRCCNTTAQWCTVCDDLLQGEVLSEVEWAWIARWVGDALNYDGGRFRLHQKGEQIEAQQKSFNDGLLQGHQVIESRFKKATADASSILKLDSRGIKLKITSMDAQACKFSALLSWPVAGPAIKSADVGGGMLPAVASLALNSTCQVPVPPGLKVGGQFLASTLDGRQATVTVPPGKSAGQVLQYTAWRAGDRVLAKRADAAKHYPAMIRAVNDAKQGSSEVTYQVDYDDGSKDECVPVICVPIEHLQTRPSFNGCNDRRPCPRQTQVWADGQWQREDPQQRGCCLIS
jgi:hypothetical protein